MEPRDEFNQNMEKLFFLLQKMLKTPKEPSASSDNGGLDLNKLLNSTDKQINLNLCFFAFLPISGDEMDDFEDSFEDYLFGSEVNSKETAEAELKFELNSTDRDFLKNHGIQF